MSHELLWQLEFIVHAAPAHEPQDDVPPQSMALSPPFCTPSAHEAA